MRIDIWQYLFLNPRSRSFSITPVCYAEGEYAPRYPVCRGNRGMIAVTSSGEVAPCLQISGTMKDRGIVLGDLHKSRLRDIIRAGAYVDTVCATVGELRESNPKCAACKWFPYCAGGCRALGLIFSGERKDWFWEDSAKCLFFENGWYEKTAEALSGWENRSKIGDAVFS